ncbi:MAG TPA: GNAT family N-acetyltransferase [Bryobacteraceae bacterium]|nr:GNAT family N-acetyltransferase [Bryobacteraceae bacterium]HOQ47266.1 GNAT family N-acetyltransferase [Bryobacteraceae bacterium]HPU74120.1 GNAT family N-acetyltransferase [Bryobacteraceae bacterium]
MSEIHVRQLTAHEEFEEAVRLQQEIWGFAPVDLLPVRLFVVASKIGGHVFGAFDGDRMVAFCLAIPGLKPGGKYYLHSHMLGVLPEYRDRGIGRMLKLEQRKDALARGFDLIEWTFDPLELRNAHFNIERLGVIVRRYVLNQYGTTTSRLHGGLPTDRCVAEWWIRTPWVEATLAGRHPKPPVEERISVPAEIGQLRSTDRRQAREIQREVSERFLDCFARGLTVTGFERSETAGTYLLGPWESA